QQAALAASERRYRELLDATSEGVIIHKNGVIIDLNPAFARLSGYTPNDLIGTHIRGLYAPEYRERIPAYLSTNEPYQTEGILRDGTRRWFEVQGHDVEYSGERVRVTTVRDITEQKALADRRAVLEREHERMRLLREFIDNLSHDLRTPLSVIRVNAYLIRKLFADPAAVVRKLETIEEQVDHLQSILTDLFDMARLEQEDSAHYPMTDLDPASFILPVVEALRPRLEAQRHTLTLDLPADLPHIHGDRDQLHRLLSHLLENAIAYTPAGGAISVRARMMPSDAGGLHVSGRHLAISVQDNGIGVDPEALPHVFDAFYRADSARNIETGGAGIGLTIARRIALAHGGTITVESAVGQGSTFTLHLPLPRPEIQSETRSLADRPGNGEGQIHRGD
ncbi:MAG: PAS domain-containing sensor histidine kinase, partial [Anaerolinea sp.]|nr:PAS domain-containing sensor histidine kinase [Anaerolinea sp.]